MGGGKGAGSMLRQRREQRVFDERAGMRETRGGVRDCHDV